MSQNKLFRQINDKQLSLAGASPMTKFSFYLSVSSVENKFTKYSKIFFLLQT